MINIEIDVISKEESDNHKLYVTGDFLIEGEFSTYGGIFGLSKEICDGEFVLNELLEDLLDTFALSVTNGKAAFIPGDEIERHVLIERTKKKDEFLFSIVKMAAANIIRTDVPVDVTNKENIGVTSFVDFKLQYIRAIEKIRDEVDTDSSRIFFNKAKDKLEKINRLFRIS